MKEFYRKAIQEEAGSQGAIVLADRADQVAESMPKTRSATNRKVSTDLHGLLRGADSGRNADVTLVDRKMEGSEPLALS